MSGAGEAASAPPKSSGYVNAGALDMYCERHGEGPPLVLLHGAFGTIESCFADLVPRLARDFEVVAVELQGHGRTRDVDRPPRGNVGPGRLAVLDDHRILGDMSSG